MERIASVARLYAHAIALEREAARRYAEFARHALDHGNQDLGLAFGWLAALEARHVEALERRPPADEPRPVLAGDEFGRLEAGAPEESAAGELVLRLATPRSALLIALEAEKRAYAFYDQVLRGAHEQALRELAGEMAAEELAHVSLIERLLENTPEPGIDWAAVFERQTTPAG